MTLWLITDEALGEIEATRKREIPPSFMAEFSARQQASGAFERAGATARIDVVGVLVEEPDPWLEFWGVRSTSYLELRSALDRANADAGISSIELFVDSPGGSVSGLFETLAAIEASAKPVTARAKLAASAAYAIASKAQRLEATSPASMFGSVGVVVSYMVSDSVVDITSTDAPNKRPNVRTEEGRAVVREQLDALHALFAEAIATGRGVTTERVNAEFGRGATLLASDALQRGMIDAVAELPSRKTSVSAAVSGEAEGTNMDLKTLKAQHPDVFAAAFDEGVASERDRVKAHLELADGSGDIKASVEAIRSGAVITQSVMAAHLAASMRRHQVEGRQAETDAAKAALDSGAAPAAAGDEAEFLSAFSKFAKEF